MESRKGIKTFKQLHTNTHYKVTNERLIKSRFGPVMILTMIQLNKSLKQIGEPVRIYVNHNILKEQKMRFGIRGKEYYLHYICLQDSESGENSYYRFELKRISYDIIGLLASSKKRVNVKIAQIKLPC